MTTANAFQVACNERKNVWLPACGGTETVFKARTGKRMLYCYNPALHKHAYLDVDSDVIMSDEEALAHLMPYSMAVAS